jgi:hypothetical protein
MTTTEYIEGKLAEFDKVGFTEKEEHDWLRSFAHDLVAETRKETLREVGEKVERERLHWIAEWEADHNNVDVNEVIKHLADLQEKMKGK